MATKYQTREEWLQHAAFYCRAHFQAAGIDCPEVNVSVGFPGGGSARTRIGECWSGRAAADGMAAVFISPTLSDAGKVLGVLVHELVHAAVGTEHGHKAPFKQAAVAVGLCGKMTATDETPELQATFAQWMVVLGDYPHAALGLSDRKKQTTRLIKCECTECGYTVRTTAKWLEVGAPLCPCNREPMKAHGDDGE